MDVPPPPPPQAPPGYGNAMLQEEAGHGGVWGAQQRTVKLAARSLITLQSRPRSEEAREALLHGANAALVQHVADTDSAGADSQPLGPRREPGMHCNCHCNHDPWAYMRGTAPPIDWSATPPPPTALPAPPPCSGTPHEWPGCKAPMRVGGAVAPLGGLPGLPKLLPVESSDLPTLGPAPGMWSDGGGSRPADMTPMPPGPPPDPQRPPPPPPSADGGSPPAVPAMTAAGPVMDCIGPKGPMVCPQDPANQNGWWGRPRPEKDVYYNAAADANKQMAIR